MDQHTLEALKYRLDHEPDNWPVRLAYSDLLEQQERMQEAQAQRWMVEHKRHPANKGGVVLVWHWWPENREEYSRMFGYPAECLLPDDLYYPAMHEPVFGVFTRRKAAERLLLLVLLKKGVVG